MLGGSWRESWEHGWQDQKHADGQREKVGSAMVVGMERGLFTFPNDRLASSGRGRDLSYRSNDCSTNFCSILPSPLFVSICQIFTFDPLFRLSLEKLSFQSRFQSLKAEPASTQACVETNFFEQVFFFLQSSREELGLKRQERGDSRVAFPVPAQKTLQI